MPALVLGALPWLLSNLHHDWWSLHPQGSGGTYAVRFHGFVSATFPMMLGLRVPFASTWLLGTALSGVVYAAASSSSPGSRGGRAVRRCRSSMSSSPLYPFLYAWSGDTSNTGEPRYLMMLVPPLVIVFASLARTVGRAALVLCVAAAVSTAGLARWVDYHDSLAPTIGSNPGEVDVAPAITVLDRAGIDRAFADYFVATRMTFDTRERMIVSEADLSALRPVRPGRVLPPKPTDYTSEPPSRIRRRRARGAEVRLRLRAERAVAGPRRGAPPATGLREAHSRDAHRHAAAARRLTSRCTAAATSATASGSTTSRNRKFSPTSARLPTTST